MAAAMAIKDLEVKPCEEVGVEQSPDETPLCGDVSQDLPSLFDEFFSLCRELDQGAAG